MEGVSNLPKASYRVGPPRGQLGWQLAWQGSAVSDVSRSHSWPRPCMAQLASHRMAFFWVWRFQSELLMARFLHSGFVSYMGFQVIR